jgi:hypothetical protein
MHIGNPEQIRFGQGASGLLKAMTIGIGLNNGDDFRAFGSRPGYLEIMLQRLKINAGLNPMHKCPVSGFVYYVENFNDLIFAWLFPNPNHHLQRDCH